MKPYPVIRDGQRTVVKAVCLHHSPQTSDITEPVEVKKDKKLLRSIAFENSDPE